MGDNIWWLIICAMGWVFFVYEVLGSKSWKKEVLVVLANFELEIEKLFHQVNARDEDIKKIAIQIDEVLASIEEEAIFEIDKRTLEKKMRERIDNEQKS
jgi:hypothetical protein